MAYLAAGVDAGVIWQIVAMVLVAAVTGLLTHIWRSGGNDNQIKVHTDEIVEIKKMILAVDKKASEAMNTANAAHQSVKDTVARVGELHDDIKVQYGKMTDALNGLRDEVLEIWKVKATEKE